MPQEDSSMELASKKAIMHIRVSRGKKKKKKREEKKLSIHLFIFVFWKTEEKHFATCPVPQEQVGSIESRWPHYRTWWQNSDIWWQRDKAALAMLAGSLLASFFLLLPLPFSLQAKKATTAIQGDIRLYLYFLARWLGFTDNKIIIRVGPMNS